MYVLPESACGARTHSRTHARTHAHRHTHTHTHTHRHTGTQAHTHTHTHARAHRTMNDRKKSTRLTNTGVGSDQQPFVRHHPNTHKTGHGQPASRAAASQSADWHNPPDGTSLGAWRSAFLEPAGWVNGCTNFLFEISKQTITDTITPTTIDYNHIPWRWQRYKWACRVGMQAHPCSPRFASS